MGSARRTGGSLGASCVGSRILAGDLEMEAVMAGSVEEWAGIRFVHLATRRKIEAGVSAPLLVAVVKLRMPELEAWRLEL